LKANRTSGVHGLISRQRSRPSSRRKPEEVGFAALSIIGKRYADFGTTLAAEKLPKPRGLCLGRKTVRIWMIEAGPWCERKKRRARVHQPRHQGETALTS
jgi:hypothetical protein